MKNILILGGSFAGVSTAHRILKQSTSKANERFKITLISPNTHFYWSIASPRGMIPGQFSDDLLFRPIASGFKQYTASQFEFIVGTAENLDIEGKKVDIDSPTGKKTLDYDYLILATGSHIKGDMPFKGVGSTEATKDALHDFQKQVRNANTIVVAGAGVTGIEVSGELGFEYGREKHIILVGSGQRVLHESPPSLSKLAMGVLQNLNVEVKLEQKIVGSTMRPNGQQELKLSNGDTLATDMYVPTFGLVPNTSYIPPKFLNANGYVMVDEYLKVRGADAVWAVGDVSDVEYSQFISCDKQSAYVAKAITLILSNGIPRPYKITKTRFMGFQIGKNAGTGHFGSWRLPSFIIVRVRRNLFLDMMEPMINGSAF